MAEIVVKIGDAGAGADQYKDGDIVDVFNSNRALFHRTQHVCNMKRFRNGSYIISGSPTEIMLKNSMQYKFERVSRTEVKRTDIVARTTDTITYADTNVHFLARAADNKFATFGSLNNEVYYDGNFNLTPAVIGAIWDKLEATTSEVRTDYNTWVFTDRILKSFLCICVDDFDDAEAGRLCEGEYDKPLMTGGVLTKNRLRTVARKNRVDWRALNLATESDIEDRTKIVDVRNRQQVLADIKITK